MQTHTYRKVVSLVITMCASLSLCSVAASGVGFILVIDRRLDRWAAVRATLLRIAVRPCVFVCVCVLLS